jgi:hypothetical protein
MSNETLEPEAIEALDNLFNAWLVAHGMLSQDGVLYKADEAGEILCDAKQNQLRVDPNEFRRLMADPEHGFKAYAAGKGARVTPVEQQFPE